DGSPPYPRCATEVVTLVTSPPDDPRLFALELNGGIRIIDHDQMLAAPFLDVASDPNFAWGAELGLLGLAFHPRYATNGQFYVFYTSRNPDAGDLAHPYLDIVARYTVSSDPTRADPASR